MGCWGGIQDSTAEAYTSAMLDRYLLTRLLVLFGLFAVTALLGWLLHTLHERSEHRVPRYRRQLVEMYESFHRFLEAVREAAVRGVRE